jgi:hypothetical protein
LEVYDGASRNRASQIPVRFFVQLNQLGKLYARLGFHRLLRPHFYDEAKFLLLTPEVNVPLNEG